MTGARWNTPGYLQSRWQFSAEVDGMMLDWLGQVNDFNMYVDSGRVVCAKPALHTMVEVAEQYKLVG